MKGQLSLYARVVLVGDFLYELHIMKSYIEYPADASPIKVYRNYLELIFKRITTI